MSLKVVLVSQNFPESGDSFSGNYAGQLSKALSELNHEIHVITTASEKTKNTHGKVTVHKIIQKWGITGLPRLLQTLMQVRPQIIHLNYTSNLLMNLLPEVNKTTMSIPLVTTFHELPSKLMSIPTLIGSNILTVPNSSLKNQIKKYEKKIEVVHEGIFFDQTFLTRPQHVENPRMKFGIKNDDKVIGFYGDISPDSAFEDVIKAIGQLISTGQQFKLLALSTWKNASANYKLTVMNLIEKNNLKNHMIISNPSSPSQIWDYMGAIDLMVIPHEVPKIRESMYRGLPTLTYVSEAGDFDYRFMDGINILFAERNHLSTKIAEFFSSPHMSQTLINGAESMRPYLGFEFVANQMSRIYSKLT